MPPSPPDSMNESLEALRKEYLERMTGTIEELKTLQQSASRGSEAAPFGELRQAFHRLAGSGATYGYPVITDTGRAAETYLDALLESADAPPLDAASRIADFIQGLEKAHAEARRS